MFHFLQRITNDAPGAPGLEEALKVAEVLAAMTGAWESGNWQEVQRIPVAL